MWRLVASASLIVSAHAIGDVFPYPNAATATYADQVAAPWDGGVCSTGKMQSPIDISTFFSKAPTSDPGVIGMTGYEQSFAYGIAAMAANADSIYMSQINPPAAATLTHTPMISGGPLPDGLSYKFNHLEFKWGSVNTVGSEHSMDGTFCPMEMQLVHYHTAADYAAAVVAAEATPDSSAIAVLSFHFEIDSADNAALTPIIDALKVPLVPGTDAQVAAMKLSELITPTGQDVLEDYYYYDGSLTLPADTTAAHGCLEAVRWVVFSKKLKISQAQLDEFRKITVMQNAGTSGTSNTRNIQTTSTATVYHRSPVNTVGTVLASALLSIGTFGALHRIFNLEGQTQALAENLVNNPVVDAMRDFEQRFIQPVVAQERKTQYQPNHHHHPQNIQY